MEKPMITPSQFEQSYHKLIQHFTQPQFSEDLILGRREFFENAGTLDENKANFSLRMNQFYDWYFLTRPLRGYMRPPVQVCDQQRELRLTDEDFQVIEILQKFKHSIYEYVKYKKEEMHIKDLFTGSKEVIMADQGVFSFDEKEFFEARIVEIDGKKHFLKGFCFHPESAQKFILDEIKMYQKNKELNFEDFLLRLNKMRYKFEQYRHVKPEMIYTNDNRLKL